MKGQGSKGITITQINQKLTSNRVASNFNFISRLPNNITVEKGHLTRGLDGISLGRGTLRSSRVNLGRNILS